MLAAATPSFAFDIKDILNTAKNAMADGTVTDMVEGVFSKTDLDVDDLAGEWTSQGSAVSFKSEDFLSEAGGIAAASAIETKINPYYKKLGLDGAVFTIQTDGSFTLKLRKYTLSGTIKKLDDGNFSFTFNALGTFSLGSIETYVQKTSQKMDVMFDATKMKTIVSAIAKFSKIKLAMTAADILDKYDGLCVGFELKKTGKVPGEKEESAAGQLINGLFGSDKSADKTSQKATSTNKNTGSQNQKASGTDKSGKASSAIEKLKEKMGKK